MKKSTLYISIFLVSFSSLFAEILLTRIFSVTLWYHFAFFVVSLTMFGLSLGGTYLFIFKKDILKVAYEKVLYVIFLLIPISLLPILFAVPKISFSFNFDPKAYMMICVLFLICQSPFFLIGFLMAYLFMHFSKDSGRIYFFDLIGASAGAFLSVFVINYLGAINSLIFLGLVASVALMLVSDRGRMRISGVVFTGFIILLLINVSFNSIHIIAAKGQKMNNLFMKWNSFSMVRVVGDEKSLASGKFAWGISPAYQGQYPPRLNMDIDAVAYTPITKFDGDLTKVEFIKYDVTSFAYHICGPIDDVLIIGPGGGRDVLGAMLFDSKKIIGVEVNPIIVNDVMRKRFKDYSGNLYGRDNVKIVVDDARSYIRNSKDKYSIIQASLVDTWAATSTGAYSLSENNLYTVEAMAEYINHLAGNGYLTISRWYSPESYKLTILFLKAAEKLGVLNPDKHIVLIKGDRIVNHIFKKTEFGEDEIKQISELAKTMRFEILYAPTVKPGNTYTQIIDGRKDLDKFIKSYTAFALKPSTDDSPFFFNKILPESVPRVLSGALKDVGIFMLYGLFIISVVFTFALILIPLYLNKRDLLRKESKSKLLYLGYFSLLGMAFMLCEVAFLQKFMLFLGYPTYSIMVVIFSLLLFAGIGSFLTSKITHDRLEFYLRIVLLLLIIIIPCYNIGLHPLFNKLLGLGIWFRISISIFLLSIAAFFMGMPFPIGIRLVGAEDKELVPLCWSLNGVFSVLGSIVAVILAMNFGFTATIFIAAGFYYAAFVVTFLIKMMSEKIRQ